ncbi:MAG: NAD-dependent epimerase/dehydratase family protein, partial [Bdellovibrionales bacterium]|nr:NAD-dependent epimerase/dehydratase family protein [Bdellovibrionales bacterium]
MKVFITGATGFVGGCLAKKLIEQGHQVTALVRNPAQCLELKSLGVELKVGDVTQLSSFESFINSETTVFHLAGVIGYSKAQRQLMNQVNIEGTRNVVSAVKKTNAQRLVYMSSVVAIGASKDGSHPLDENSNYDIKNLNLGYFETKRIAEEIVLSAAHINDIDAVALNPSTIYGAGDAKKGSRKTQLKVARGEFPFYTSGGVSIIAIEDVIAATLKAWDVGRSGERYILDGDNITIHELF